MPGFVSISARRSMYDQASSETMVLLARITHPALTAPILLSSDPTKRISLDPLVYGTHHKGDLYRFVWMGTILPDDRADDAPSATLVFTNVGSDIAHHLRAVSSPAALDLTIVLASTPDWVEREYLGMRTVKVSYDGSEISLEVARDAFATLALPFHRMTADRFPGLFP